MSDFFTSRFFPCTALALIGMFIAAVGYVNFNEFAASSVELGLSRLTLPAVIGTVAVLFSIAGVLCSFRHSN